VEIELHTHRHWSPGDEALGVRELRDNAAEIARITGRTARHLCYPSGRYDRWREEWLAGEGVRSGTTCVPGFVDARTPRYRLGRFLDGENIDQLDFEAELAGVLELARRLRARLKGPRAEWFADDPAEDRPRAVPTSATA
jgi:peptidoglycan/xylan/chitin deacetylase (PgdA/CDA1 family)